MRALLIFVLLAPLASAQVRGASAETGRAAAAATPAERAAFIRANYTKFE
jgi:hypothetical protein